MSYLTLQITKFCNAGCSHCEFTEYRDSATQVEIALQIELAASSYSHVIVTGGEPFQSSNLRWVLDELDRHQLMYRIATGGHVPLESHMSALVRASGLCGLQMGSDVLLAERGSERHRDTWHSNIRLLGIHAIPYSITFTADAVVDPAPVVAALNHTRPTGVRISRMSRDLVYADSSCVNAVVRAAEFYGVEVTYDNSL